MEPKDVLYHAKDYIKTSSNLISRKAIIKAPQRVEMRGKVSSLSLQVAVSGEHLP